MEENRKRKTKYKEQVLKENKYQEKERQRVEENGKNTKIKKKMKETVKSYENKVTLKGYMCKHFIRFNKGRESTETKVKWKR